VYWNLNKSPLSILSQAIGTNDLRLKDVGAFEAQIIF
jgi:hypothetical protein